MKKLLLSFSLFILGGFIISKAQAPDYIVPWNLVCALWIPLFLIVLYFVFRPMFMLDDNNPNDREIKEAWEQVKTHGKGVVREYRKEQHLKNIERKTNQRIKNIMEKK